jgi:hypothetical protein
MLTFCRRCIIDLNQLKNAQLKLAREPAIPRRSHLVIAILLVTFIRLLIIVHSAHEIASLSSSKEKFFLKKSKK